MDHRHLWLRSPRQQAILRSPSRSDQCGSRLLRRPRLHPRRYADLHAGRVRGHDDAVPGRVLRRREGVSDAERPALQRSERDGVRQGLLLRPDVPRREIEDAAAPDRVLDGRARSRVRRPRRRDATSPRLSSSRSSTGCSQRRQRELEGARTRRAQARARAGAVPAPVLRRGRRDRCKTKGLPFEWGGDFGAPDETALSEQFDRPVWCIAIPRPSRRST